MPWKSHSNKIDGSDVAVGISSAKRNFPTGRIRIVWITEFFDLTKSEYAKVQTGSAKMQIQTRSLIFEPSFVGTPRKLVFVCFRLMRYKIYVLKRELVNRCLKERSKINIGPDFGNLINHFNMTSEIVKLDLNRSFNQFFMPHPHSQFTISTSINYILIKANRNDTGWQWRTGSPVHSQDAVVFLNWCGEICWH